MKKKTISLLCVILIMISLSVPAFALDESVPIDSVLVADDNAQVSPRGVYIREFVGYDPSVNQRNLKYTHVGTVEGKNTSGSVATVYFYYQTSGTTSASLGANVTTQAEINAIVSKVGVSLGITVTTSRSWTAGTNSGGSLVLNPGASGKISGYIPGVTFSGSLQYKVYMDGYEDNWWYEYKTVSNAYVPQSGYTYIEFS